MTTATRTAACVAVPPGALGNYRDEVGELMHLAGRPLDPHQLEAIEALTSYGRGGKWLSFVAGVEGPRQTVGKTGGILLPIALFLSLTFPEYADERTWTAHRLDTTAKTFRDARALLGVDDADQANWRGPLAAKVLGVGLENGNEHIAFRNGSILWFKARSGRAGRGLSGHDVFADELLYATDEQFDALLPTMATRSATGNPRLWTGSSSALATSNFLRRLRKRATSGDPGVAYVGWWARGSWSKPGCATAPNCLHTLGSVGCALDDPALHDEANPGLGVRTSPSFLVEMRRQLTPLGFGREFLGWQEEEDGATDLTLEVWEACEDPDSRPMASPVVLAIDTTKGLRSAVVAACGWREDGLAHGELLRVAAGTSWIVPFAKDMQERTGCPVLMLGGSATSQALLPEFEAAGVRVTEVPTTDYTAACVFFVDEVKNERFRHLGDQHAADAVKGAASRDIGDGGSWRWSPKDSTADVAPLVALTLARWELTRHQPYDLAASVG